MNPDIPEEIQKYADTLAEKFKTRSKIYVKNAKELKREGPKEIFVSEEAPVNDTSWWPPYPWWNIFLVGPIQWVKEDPESLKPAKILVYGKDIYFIVFVWRNSAGIKWTGGPSAQRLMSGQPFRINFEIINLTKVQQGSEPEPAISDTFSDFLQWYVVKLPVQTQPSRERPDLYHLYATIDLSGQQEQQMSGFSTWLFEPEIEPVWWMLPSQTPKLQMDVPAQFMIYMS